MANYIFLVVVLIFACTSAVFVPPRPGHRHHEPQQQQQQKVHLLGTKECTWGPSYWCKNLTAAADCNAVKHCIQTVWIHKQLPPDTSNVCQICLDMVKQARDQLESNETQELLKEVFEGSCALLHIKPIVEECDKIADNYIPELVETLASEMNPQVVCAVAGFCNNDKFIKLAHEQIDKEETKPLLENCNNCLIVGKHLENRLQTVPFEDFTNNLLLICRKFDSFTDSCSNIILKYSFDIYQRLKTEFNPNEFCLLTGECSSIFHTHDIEITPISHIGYIDIKQDNLPCDLCKQLVTHLKDLLITNTTEIEFKRVLQGLCKQTGEFKQECLNLVEQYYSEIYNFLLTELNSSAVCAMMGLCPNQIQQPIMPLILTEENVGKALKIIPKQPQLNLLPIDLLVPPHTQILYNHQLCVFCEYFMHYLQQAITDPKSEQEIKRVIDEACQKLPSSINQTCVKFVDMYEPALIALLAQEIDPSTICPLIKACPEPNNQHDIEIFIHQQIKDNEKCPLCLFAVSKLEDMVKNEKTEENIKNALSKLCVKLPKNLADECNDFVKTYTNELIDMLIADLDPQEICVYLKLCTDNKLPDNSHLNTVGDIETNIIRDNTIDGKIAGSEPLDYHQENAECVLCEFIMKELQDQLKDNATEEEIKRIVHNVCEHLPTTIKNECNDFVNEYADTIIQLLIATTVPDEICRVMHLCPDQSKLVRIHAEVLDCAICESLVYMIEKVLANPNVDHNVKHVLEKACRALPTHEQEKCIDIIEKYGKTIYELVIHLANKGLVCHEIGMCATKVARIETPIDN